MVERSQNHSIEDQAVATNSQKGKKSQYLKEGPIFLESVEGGVANLGLSKRNLPGSLLNRVIGMIRAYQERHELNKMNHK